MLNISFVLIGASTQTGSGVIGSADCDIFVGCLIRAVDAEAAGLMVAHDEPQLWTVCESRYLMETFRLPKTWLPINSSGVCCIPSAFWLSRPRRGRSAARYGLNISRYARVSKTYINFCCSDTKKKYPRHPSSRLLHKVCCITIRCYRSVLQLCLYFPWHCYL